MFILKCSFKKVIYNLLKINNINKSLPGSQVLDSNFTFKFYNRAVHSNIKTNSIFLKLVNENLLCRTCVRWRQHMRLQRFLNYCCNLIYLLFVIKTFEGQLLHLDTYIFCIIKIPIYEYIFLKKQKNHKKEDKVDLSITPPKPINTPLHFSRYRNIE